MDTILSDCVQFGPLLVLATILAVLSSYKWYTAHGGLPLPPGPRPLPLIGNVLDIPMRNLGECCRRLNAKYGDVVYLNVFGQPTVILGSRKAVNDLLETRASISSDRSRSPMAEMTGFMWDFALEGYNSRWRARRRIFHQLFYPNAIKSYRPKQLREVQRMLQKLVTNPGDFVGHITHYFGASIMGIVYGLELDDHDDKYLEIARKVTAVFIDITVPGRYIVETLHFLRHIPSWLPGAGFKRKALAWWKDVQAQRDVPFEAVVENIANGTARPCIVTSLLENSKLSQMSPEDAAEHEEVLKDVAAVAYATGADTTLSSVVAFFLAMTIYTEVQKKAQAELDAVIGRSRLPNFDDRPGLPYVNALMKECFRWHVVLPLGIPHRTVADMVYEGYHIPKGTSLISNAWALSRDPSEYPDPEEFRPERFLNTTADPMEYVFGKGRRICPGRHFADATLFIIVASVLHTLTIEPPLDETGKPMKVEAVMSKDMLLSYPEPFKCRIKARVPEAEVLINTQGFFGDE